MYCVVERRGEEGRGSVKNEFCDSVQFCLLFRGQTNAVTLPFHSPMKVLNHAWHSGFAITLCKRALGWVYTYVR